MFIQDFEIRVVLAQKVFSEAQSILQKAKLNYRILKSLLAENKPRAKPVIRSLGGAKRKASLFPARNLIRAKKTLADIFENHKTIKRQLCSGTSAVIGFGWMQSRTKMQ